MENVPSKTKYCGESKNVVLLEWTLNVSDITLKETAVIHRMLYMDLMVATNQIPITNRTI